MRRMVLGLCLVGMLAAACSTASGPGRQGIRRPPRASSTSAPAPSSTSTTVWPNAAGTNLAAYLSAAARADSLLKTAAAAVNGDVGAETLNLSPATAAAIEAADPAPAGNAVPAGLPDDLLARVMLVQSDLVSRWAALEGYRRLQGSTLPVARGDPAAQDALGCLGNGAAAATSTGADTRALQSAAAQVPPFTPAAPDSQEAADVQILLQSIELQNLGCGSCGGYRMTTLPDIEWYPSPHPSSVTGLPPTNGTIHGIEFEANYSPSTGWQINIHAC